MTTSNHGPYIIPPNINFSPKHSEVRHGCVEYADWAIGQFMQNASKQKWFANTIFVFIADHGTWEGDNYADLALSLNHIPCIIYSPILTDAPKIIDQPGGQIDLFPTVAGLLHFTYTNNTLGIDLLHDERKWIYFSQDDKVAVTDNKQLYIWHKDNRENMLTLNEKMEVLNNKRSLADSMQQFAFSMIQTAQFTRENNKTGPVLKL